jgi:hypothetical protein
LIEILTRVTLAIIVFGTGMYSVVTGKNFGVVQMVFYTVFATGFFVDGITKRTKSEV